MSYDGSEVATRDRVRRYLRDNYTDTDYTALSDARLTELLTDHGSYLERGEKVGSFASYVGNQIADAAELPEFEEEDGGPESAG